MKAKWNLFAEGECEEEELASLLDRERIGVTHEIVFTLRTCKVCGEKNWLRERFNACNNCIP